MKGNEKSPLANRHIESPPAALTDFATMFGVEAPGSPNSACHPHEI